MVALSHKMGRYARPDMQGNKAQNGECCLEAFLRNRSVINTGAHLTLWLSFFPWKFRVTGPKLLSEAIIINSSLSNLIYSPFISKKESNQKIITSSRRYFEKRTQQAIHNLTFFFLNYYSRGCIAERCMHAQLSRNDYLLHCTILPCHYLELHDPASPSPMPQTLPVRNFVPFNLQVQPQETDILTHAFPKTRKWEKHCGLFNTLK